MSIPNPASPTGSRPYKKKVGPDTAVFGLLIGLLFPALGLILLYFIWSRDISFSKYLQMFTAISSPIMMSTASKALSLSMIANLAPFYFFLNRKQYLTVRGILMSMILIGVLVVLYKFVWQ
ncbi:hypothetical protein [Taibaiella koreensis]|uniref:hypothetical protein n=1 Tax=Taibaiella koreensis TaxID=1268548 RepID=UPI000E59E63B|nr:hypothetical protein [Taibaiella koreensis]